MKKIIDKFTNLPISRQYKYQLRKYKQRKCIICGRKLDFKNRNYCKFHRINHMISNRENQRKYIKAKKRYLWAESYKAESYKYEKKDIPDIS